MCKPIFVLVSNALFKNNKSLWEVQTVRHPVSHPVLHTVYQTNVAEQWTRTQSQLGSIKSSIQLMQARESLRFIEESTYVSCPVKNGLIDRKLGKISVTSTFFFLFFYLFFLNIFIIVL